jgi:hypothetical protein
MKPRATSGRKMFFLIGLILFLGILIGLILFLYYEESLVSSNLNSKLLRFHCAHPNLGTTCTDLLTL